MTPDELEDLAFRGAEMPKGLNAAEQALFQSLRRLYAYAKLTHMTTDQGKREKTEILKAFRVFSFWMRVGRHTDRMWKEIESAGNRYRLDRTLENADAFIKAVYGVGGKIGKEQEAEQGGTV